MKGPASPLLLGAGEEREIPSLTWTSLLLMLLLGVAGTGVVFLISPWLVGQGLNISAALQRPCQPYFLLLHCAEADVIFPNCGSLTRWRCASTARTGLVSTSMSPDHGTPGNGLLLFFRVDYFDLALQRARSLVSRLEEEPHHNSNTRTKEFRSEIRKDITLRSVRSGG